MPKKEKIYINGIDGETGDYLMEPSEYSQVAKYVKGEQVNKPLVRLPAKVSPE